MIQANVIFPYKLAKCTGNVIQIATDCVFSGKKGFRSEDDIHDATDLYGRTKSLGEVKAPNMMHLVCSIIGPEISENRVSLMSRFLDEKIDKGLLNHFWNGITTLHFAKICQGIIRNGIEPFHIQHIIPGDWVNKYELLNMIAKAFSRLELRPSDVFASDSVNRVLITNNTERNIMLWQMAGYSKPPDIEQMVEELVKYMKMSRLWKDYYVKYSGKMKEMIPSC
jgi:dTDP-4-dehydrorhamnose reductase